MGRLAAPTRIAPQTSDYSAGVDIKERGSNSVTIAFAANELLSIVNALELALRGADGSDDADTNRRVQRPLVDALRILRPKLQLSGDRWVTDWARGEDGKHL